VEQHGHPVDDREPCEGILQLVPQLGALEDEVRRDRVVVVLPLGLDSIDVEFVVMRPRPVDDAIDQAPSEPRGESRAIPKLVTSAPGTDDRLLGAVLGLVRVTDQSRCKVYEPWELRRERLGEVVPMRGQSSLRDARDAGGDRPTSDSVSGSRIACSSGRSRTAGRSPPPR
jgi:hypothetical protein